MWSLALADHGINNTLTYKLGVKYLEPLKARLKQLLQNILIKAGKSLIPINRYEFLH